jgi:prepilin-type N-terminal cleavage/methylation domain-containing protein
MSYRTATRRAFSLIELVIVVVIIGIIAAIAVPRMSRGAAGAGDGALVSNLQVLRNAIDLFQTEHGGIYPAAATIETQLTGYSKDDGSAQATKDNTYYLGPYLQKVPPLPVGTKKGNNLIKAADGAGVGWLYDDTTHEIKANLAGEKDARNKDYSQY